MSKPSDHFYRSIFRNDLFAGSIILITGGGSGIGRCAAHELAALGAHVVLLGRRQDRLDAVLSELASDGLSGEAISLDIRDEPAIEAAIAALITRHGRIDALVNNAGGQFPAPLASISKKGFEAVVATNLTGGFLLAKACFNASMKQHGGAIVNIVADMWNGMPGMGHSGAARAGMVNLTKTAAFEWASFGVRVNAVAPGWIASSGLDQYGEAMKPMIKALHRSVPLHRLGTEAEVSAGICFLLSPAAAFITGAVLQIDGGAPLGHRAFPLPPEGGTIAFEGFHRAQPVAMLAGDAS
ncbi:citronellol/citronellal dehydrogenase [Acidiphilium sp. MT5]